MIILVMVMRIYYIFNIKDEFVKLYRDYPSTLYGILNHMYHMRDNDLTYGYNLFNQIALPIDKEKIDRDIFVMLHNKMIYSKKDGEHIINDLYKDDVSILKVKHTHILLNSNKSYTEFFRILESENPNLFACDFLNSDYFFLTKLKTLV